MSEPAIPPHQTPPQAIAAWFDVGAQPGLPQSLAQLALALGATAYGFDLPAWRAEGWGDIISCRGPVLDKAWRVVPLGQAPIRSRRYLAQRVENPPAQNTPAAPPPPDAAVPMQDDILLAAGEKAVVLARPLGQGKHLIAVVFRGTGSTLRDWEPNLNCSPRYGFHCGFYSLAQTFWRTAAKIPLAQAARAFNKPRLTLWGVQQSLKSADSPFFLLLCGYSQGAAVMQLYAHMLLKSGVQAQHVLGCGFASPSVAFAQTPGLLAHYPLYHIANGDDLTPRTGAAIHLGQVLHYAPDAAMRAACYGRHGRDARFRLLLAQQRDIQNTEQTQRAAAAILRAALGLPRADLLAFIRRMFHFVGADPGRLYAEGYAALILRVLLRRALVLYRAAYGRPLPDDRSELKVLLQMLRMGAGTYAAHLLRVMSLPHTLVRAPGDGMGCYDYIVQQAFDSLRPQAYGAPYLGQ